MFDPSNVHQEGARVRIDEYRGSTHKADSRHGRVEGVCLCNHLVAWPYAQGLMAMMSASVPLLSPIVWPVSR